MAEGDASGIPYINCRISLISKREVRYEGILTQINTHDSTVTLSKVRSYGTEGRCENPSDELPAMDTGFDFIIFKGSDIKDLHVRQNSEVKAEKEEEAAAAQQQVQQDPAVLSSQSVAVEAEEKAAAPMPPKPPAQKRQENKKPRQRNNNANAQAGNNRPQHQQNPSALPGMGGHLLHRRTRGGQGDTPQVEGEFDFEKGLQGFNKDEEMAKLSIGGGTVGESSDENATETKEGGEGEGETAKKDPAYNKGSSFFDSISCDALDRLNGLGARMRAAEERTLNTETFGAVALNDTRRYHNRRGGYRGGRGGRGGGGRGGYGRRYNNFNNDGGNNFYNNNNRGGRGGGRGAFRGRGGGRGQGQGQGQAAWGGANTAAASS